jgi:dUTP pyrophosphatase
MNKVMVKVFNSGDHELPKYESTGAAGMDVFAKEDVTILSGMTTLVPTGLFVEIPLGYEIQVRPRSGLSLKTGLRVANSPGTVDSDYRGEIKVIMTNTSNFPIEIKKGDRVAQLVLCEVPQITWVEVNTQEELSDTNRGGNGFGSTGK